MVGEEEEEEDLCFPPSGEIFLYKKKGKTKKTVIHLQERERERVEERKR